jgi:N-[(2S)-2-amino-2-carboxyethyl]-L-glutamate dehydrogenase
MTPREDLRPSSFDVISGAAVHSILVGRQNEMINLIEKAYTLHGGGETTNPGSYFLRFPDKPSARIIALPAAVRGDIRIDGLKWVSSYPDNLERGIPRASAVLLLNDVNTGYPLACIEGSIISAVRTAASAAVALRHVARSVGRPASIGFIGTGLIARYLYEYLCRPGERFDRVGVHDLSADYARGFAEYVTALPHPGAVRIYETAEELIRSHDLIVFATTAGRPHITDPDWLSHNPIVLHVSLRDLDPAIILSSANIVDDVDHVLKADTSIHLTEQRSGHRDFIDATLYDVIEGSFAPGPGRPVVFSPFGLGVLDLVIGEHVYRRAAATGRSTTVPDFFHDMDRHDPPRPGSVE